MWLCIAVQSATVLWLQSASMHVVLKELCFSNRLLSCHHCIVSISGTFPSASSVTPGRNMLAQCLTGPSSNLYSLASVHLLCMEHVLYMRVVNDEILWPFFQEIDLARLKNKLVRLRLQIACCACWPSYRAYVRFERVAMLKHKLLGLKPCTKCSARCPRE